MSNEILFYASVFVIAGLAGLTRVVYNGDYKSLGHCVASAFLAAFFGGGLVAIIYDWNYLPNARPAFFLGIASFAGLSGKEQVQYIGAVNRWVIKKIGFAFRDGEAK